TPAAAEPHNSAASAISNPVWQVFPTIPCARSEPAREPQISSLFATKVVRVCGYGQPLSAIRYDAAVAEKPATGRCGENIMIEPEERGVITILRMVAGKGNALN